MYPVHHPTLKIEQAERQAEAARLRLAAASGGRRRRWSLAAWLGLPAAPGADPAPMTPVPTPASGPAGSPAGTVADDDRVLVGR